MEVTTAAFVGAIGGAGTTRTTLEVATVLASAGRSVAVLDADYATQGLGRYLSGRLDPDLTTLVTDELDRPLSAGLVDLDVGLGDSSGRIACCPAYAPFERLARAKTIAAARALEERIDEATAAFDHVLVDTPPVASNQAIAAVTSTDRVVLVTRPTAHGLDAAQRMRSRLQDVQSRADAVVAVGDADGDGNAVDVTISETTDPFPAASDDDRFGRDVAAVIDTVFDDGFGTDFVPRGLRDRLASIGR